MTGAGAPLAGLRVWLTRPAGRNTEWTDAIAADGGDVEIEPLLVVETAKACSALTNALDRAQNAQYVVVTSASAVAAIRRLKPDFAPAGTLLAVGPASAAALEALCGRAVRYPMEPTSEGVLALGELVHVAGRSVAILGGEGGRSVLADTLIRRAARVEKLALYRRRRAPIPVARLANLLARCDAIVVTSGAGLRVLADYMAQTAIVAKPGARLIVPNARVAECLTALPPGLEKPLTLNTMSTQALLAHLRARAPAINNGRGNNVQEI